MINHELSKLIRYDSRLLFRRVMLFNRKHEVILLIQLQYCIYSFIINLSNKFHKYCTKQHTSTFIINKGILYVVFRGKISGWVGPLDLHTLLYIAQLRLTSSLVH
jgi:hypothetical protein